MAEPTGHLTEFTVFSKLPNELKDKIWDESTEGRVIEVVYDEANDVYTTQVTMPPIFSVCKESRQQAFASYELLEMVDIYGCPKRNQVHFETYINLEKDILYLSLAHLEGYRGMRGPDDDLPYLGANLYAFLTNLSGFEEIASRLRHIAFQAESCDADLVSEGLSGLSGLSEISIVYGDKCCVHDGILSHRNALALVDVPRTGGCAHLHTRTAEEEQEMKDGIAELKEIVKQPKKYPKGEGKLGDRRNETKLVMVPKMLVRGW